jgi:hypothetical protein
LTLLIYQQAHTKVGDHGWHRHIVWLDRHPWYSLHFKTNTNNLARMRRKIPIEETSATTHTTTRRVKGRKRYQQRVGFDAGACCHRWHRNVVAPSDKLLALVPRDKPHGSVGDIVG